MNWSYILLVFALVLAFIQAVIVWMPPNPNGRVLPHLGWLAFTCYIASILIARHAPL